MYGAADKPTFAEVELMIAVQLIVYLLVFTLMVKIAVRDNALNGIYFYPREVQKRAVEIGLIDEAAINKRAKAFYDRVLYCDGSFAFSNHRLV